MKRREARETAFILTFEMSYQQEPVAEIIKNAAEGRDLVVDAFAEHLAGQVWDHNIQLDDLIGKYSTKWKVDRLSRVAASLLRMAMCEILYIEDVPVSVSINEAVELAKKYGGDDDAPFVNGVLGAFAREMEKDLHKPQLSPDEEPAPAPESAAQEQEA